MTGWGSSRTSSRGNLATTDHNHDHVGVCTLLVKYTETWVDDLCLTTVQEVKQRFQTTQMAMVTALHGFKRRPVLLAQTAGGTPTTDSMTNLKATAVSAANKGASNKLKDTRHE